MDAKNTGRLIWLWGLVPLIAVAEIALQWQIPRLDPAEEDWDAAVREVTRSKGRHDLVTIAPEWASPVGRMHLGYLISMRDLGRFDTTQYDRIIEVSENGARTEETEGLKLTDEKPFGRLVVRTYETGRPRVDPIYDFVDSIGAARARGFDLYRPRYMIDHWFIPRFVIPVDLGRGTASITYEQAPLEGIVRGYGLIGRTSGEFDRGGPISMTAYAGNREIGRAEFTNLGRLRPFEFDLPGKGRGPIRFDFRAEDYSDREFGFAADVRPKTGGGR